MSALIVRIGPVRNAVQMSARLGSNEPRQSIVSRIVGDIRDGFHPYRAPLTDLQRVQQAGRVPAQAGAA